MDVKQQKKQLRAALRAQSAALPPAARLESDGCIRARLEALEAWRRAKTVFCYVSVGPEIDTRALLGALLAGGRRVCVPRCLGDGVMEALAISSLKDLAPGAFGLPEPAPNAPVVAPETIDLIIVPALCADEEGARLGQGGGYYDRYLPRTSALRVCPCRAALLQKALPTERFDQIMDLVVTEEHTYDGRKRA